MVAQKIVKQGCRWQVGNGTSVGIWTDKWLPKPSTFKVISLPNNNFEPGPAKGLGKLGLGLRPHQKIKFS